MFCQFSPSSLNLKLANATIEEAASVGGFNHIMDLVIRDEGGTKSNVCPSRRQ